MLSYHNDANLKDMIVAEMKLHQAQDRIIKGTYGEDKKFMRGCAVGCAIDSMNKVLGKDYYTCNHEAFEEAIGVPEWLAHLQDTIFEGLPMGDNSQFAVDLLEAIPVGVNLAPVKHKFCAFILRETLELVSKQDISLVLMVPIVSAIKNILALHENAAETGTFDKQTAEAASEVAEYVAEAAAKAARAEAWAAWTAAEAASEVAETAAWAARSARAASWAAAWAAADAARDVASTAAWAAESAAVAAEDERVTALRAAALAETEPQRLTTYKRYADTLLKMLKTCTKLGQG